MAFEPDTLGLPSTGLPLLRDLIHERTGLFYDNGRYDTLNDRLAPLVLQRGFRSFLDFYYLLKYDEREAAGGMAPRHGCAVGAGNLFLAGDRPDPRPGVHASCRTCCATTPDRPDPYLERSLRDRRGAADDRDGARRGRLVRSGADRDPRQRCEQPSPSTRRGRRDTANARFARCRRRCARNTSSAKTACRRPVPELRARITSLERGQPDGAARNRAVRPESRSSSAATPSSTFRRRASRRWPRRSPT